MTEDTSEARRYLPKLYKLPKKARENILLCTKTPRTGRPQAKAFHG